MHTPMNVVAYCRVSTDTQDNTRQRDELEAWAERMGWNLIGTVEEKASGTSCTRPMRRELMAIAKQPHLTPTSINKLVTLCGTNTSPDAKRIDAIIIHEPSRWSRSMVDHVTTLQDLAGHGVSVLTLNGMSLDVSTPEGKFMVTVFAGLAELERDALSMRVKSGMAAAARAGRLPGRPPSDTLAKLGPRAYELKQSQMPITQIAIQLGTSRRTVYRAIEHYLANTVS